MAYYVTYNTTDYITYNTTNYVTKNATNLSEFVISFIAVLLK